MERLIQLDTPAEFEHYQDVAGAPALDREKIKADAPAIIENHSLKKILQT